MESTNNSLTQFLTQLLRIQKNSMEIVGKLNDVTTGNAESVTIELENVDGTSGTYSLPSIGYLENQISRLDSNFKAISGLDGGSVNVRMPDGSFKKIIQSNLFKQPKIIQELLVPSTFGKKNNWFFESFLNPLLYVSFDITKYVDYDTHQVSYKRIILNCDDDTKKQFFNSSIKGRNDIEYDTLISDLFNNKISYFVDEDVANLPVSIPKYSGSFDVISFKDENVQVIKADGKTVSTKIRKYRLNTLKYTDNLQNFKDTLQLKIGDFVDVGDSTRYEVTLVDTSTNTVSLKMTSGTESIPIGTSVLNISLESFSVKEVQINVGFDEREVIFIKAIDRNSNLTSRNFSTGVGIFTNELVITLNNKTVNLSNFYKQEVMDFGNSLLALAKEGTIPAIYGEKPDPPRIADSNFKVTLANAQKLDTKVIDNLKKKISQKNSTLTEITQIESSIEKKKQELNVSKFNSDSERRAVQNQLESLINEKTSKSNLYASLIKDLSATAKNLPGEVSSPKYRVRGFFPIPQPKVSAKTLDQSVVAFQISYRYLRVDGTSPGTDQYDFIDNNGEVVRGYFSNWQTYETPARTKYYDANLGIYAWKDENVQDADIVNINQVDIPITKGEQVEIRIKSLSEAGWPVNPASSDWSSSVIIPFPENLSADDEVVISLSSALTEESRVNFNQDLAARGLDTHLSSSYVQKDKYYAHTSDVVSSGFYDTQGNAIDLYSKLKELDNKIASLQAIIEKAKGKLQVYIVDPNGEKYLVANNSLVDLFAGYYSDIVSTYPTANQKGAIISLTYKLLLENVAVSTLQLASKFPGGLDTGLPVSLANIDADYAISRRYDLVPLSLASLDQNKLANSFSYHSAPFQSAQRLSQYLYLRYTDLGLKTPIYSFLTGPGSIIGNNTFYPLTGGAGSPFIWDYSYTGTTPNTNGGDNAFCVHISHPDINDGLATSLNDLNEPTGASTNAPAVYPKMIQSSFFNLQSYDHNGKVQTQFLQTDLNGVTTEKYPVKLGFYSNDRYLIGSNTCGSYLFLSPSTYSDLLVDGVDYRAIRDVEYGESNQLIIPMIYQFRMTDYFGSGNSGLGRIGGYSTQPKNLVYSKKIGIDINVKDETLFSFDVQITSKYKVDSPSQTAISPAKNTKLPSPQAELIKQIF